MKLGLGLYRDSLNEDNFKFTRQAGATHVVVHLVDYFKGKNPKISRGSELKAGEPQPTRVNFGLMRN